MDDDKEITPGEPGGWVNIGQIHTVPADELEKHALAPGCACGPTMKTNDQVLIYTHNSYDGREMRERNAKLISLPVREET